jgi:hypothetical protein
VRAAAEREARDAHALRDARLQQALHEAQWAFREREISRITTIFSEEQRRATETKKHIASLQVEGDRCEQYVRAIENVQAEVEVLKRDGGTVRQLDAEHLPEDIWLKLEEMGDGTRDALLDKALGLDDLEHETGLELW